MAVLTIFNHGTGFNRAKGVEANELIGWLHTNVDGQEARMQNGQIVAGNHIINEGPGSTSGGIALPSEVNPMTGRMRNDEQVKLGKGQAGRARSDFARGFAGQAGGGRSALAGNIAGVGWDENVQRTVHLIQSLKFDGLYDVTTVNMAGWSRGGVTSIRIANKLYEVFGNSIECNIIGLDPVAGQDAGVVMDDTRRLPPSVKNYIAILAMNEERRSFAPQDMSRMIIADPSVTTTCFLPMPGKHNEQVMGRSGVAMTPEANISRNLAVAFLRHFGSPFRSIPAPAYVSALAMAQAYAEVRLAVQGHQYRDSSGIGARLVGLGLGRRDFAKTANMNAYVAGGKTSYWVNEHHRACFKAACPDVYRTIFENSARTGQFTPINPGHLASIGGAQSAITRSLTGMGYLSSQAGRLTIHFGSGVYVGRPVQNRWPAALPLHV
ncbi:MAG: hypothetical protein R3F60_19305 [bacterium]